MIVTHKTPDLLRQSRKQETMLMGGGHSAPNFPFPLAPILPLTRNAGLRV